MFLKGKSVGLSQDILIGNIGQCFSCYRHYLQVSLLTNRTRNGINLPMVMVQYGLQWPSTSLPLYGATWGDSRPYQEFAGGFEGRGYVQEKVQPGHKVG